MSGFIAKTQSPLVCDDRFEEFTIPLLAGFVVVDRDEVLPSPISTIKKYLSRTEQYHQAYSILFVSVNERNKWAPRNIMSFWIKLVIAHAYKSATDEDCKAVKVKAH